MSKVSNGILKCNGIFLSSDRFQFSLVEDKETRKLLIYSVTDEVKKKKLISGGRNTCDMNCVSLFMPFLYS